MYFLLGTHFLLQLQWKTCHKPKFYSIINIRGYRDLLLGKKVGCAQWTVLLEMIKKILKLDF